MEDKIVDCTQHSRELANKAINDSIDRAKLFITHRMYNMAIDELDYLKRLISIQDKYDALLFKMQKQQIEILSTKTEA
jgi:hypothetical protein